jgi:hypothetical protein
MCRDTTEYDTLPNDAGILQNAGLHHYVAATFCYYSVMQQLRLKVLEGQKMGVGAGTIRTPSHTIADVFR